MEKCVITVESALSRTTLIVLEKPSKLWLNKLLSDKVTATERQTLILSFYTDMTTFQSKQKRLWSKHCNAHRIKSKIENNLLKRSCGICDRMVWHKGYRFVFKS